ncbi:type II toxin-antitoxin system RelE/ParE family toxin [Oribacterium sp. P6A1]|uniref:type II toxin-antitoxin system RelE/ParE family toxin n=1 Tax=Oribacterium sp. P6A1 TaxID=1410612 RepID=UPI000562AF20|nr:type II toxin-antitoxin system RelE/ParE family toxin [Oribacterium sp. P6A1]
MYYELVYSPAALEDLDQVWNEVYTSSTDLSTTDNYISALRNELKEICKNPKLGKRLCYEDVFTGIYYISCKKYNAFYRIRANKVEVGRILYNRSNYMKLVLGSM